MAGPLSKSITFNGSLPTVQRRQPNVRCIPSGHDGNSHNGDSVLQKLPRSTIGSLCDRRKHGDGRSIQFVPKVR